MNEILEFIKNGFRDDVVTVPEAIATLLLTSVLAVYIFYMYKLCSRAVLYSRNFNVTMSAMSVVTAVVIMVISRNFGLSLGMVGALSIVRFRTAIKDPVDLLFIFWSITVGIAMGAGMYRLSVIGCIVVALVLMVLNFLPTGGTSYLLVFGCRDDESAKQAITLMGQATRRRKLKSRSVTVNGIELTYEVSVNGAECEFITALNAVEGVTHAALVAYDGEFVA